MIRRMLLQTALAALLVAAIGAAYQITGHNYGLAALAGVTAPASQSLLHRHH